MIKMVICWLTPSYSHKNHPGNSALDGLVLSGECALLCLWELQLKGWSTVLCKFVNKIFFYKIHHCHHTEASWRKAFWWEIKNTKCHWTHPCLNTLRYHPALKFWILHVPLNRNNYLVEFCKSWHFHYHLGEMEPVFRLSCMNFYECIFFSKVTRYSCY